MDASISGQRPLGDHTQELLLKRMRLGATGPFARGLIKLENSMLKHIAIIAAALPFAGVAGFLYLESDPGGPAPSLDADVPSFIGSPAVPKPIASALAQPIIQHPYLAMTGNNSMHNDAAQSDAYRWSGPLGIDAKVQSRQFHRLGGACVAQTFDQAGRMLGTCVGPFGVTLVARDPETLEILARQSITRWVPWGMKFSGGVYFHLDHEDHVLLASNDLAIDRWALREAKGEFSWERVGRIDISAPLELAAEGPHHVIDVMPDWNGDYWFITRAGLVGMIDRAGGKSHAIALGEPGSREGIDNALAVGENGVFVVSSHAMYNFGRAADGEIETRWREAYDRGSAQKAGTMGFGSGTTPTLVGNDYVAITDNADGRVNVVVYAQEPRSGEQQVCAVPVFKPDRGTSENSLSAVGNALIVENNFGYEGPRNIPESESGLARVDIRGGRCDTVWETHEITSPSAVPKTSLANGLIYVYTRDEGNPADLHAWYFTAVDFETGALVYKQLTGVGWKFNNHYGSITIARDGSAYASTMGGLLRISDSR